MALQKIILDESEWTNIKNALQHRYYHFRDLEGSSEDKLKYRQFGRKLIGIITKIDKQMEAEHE